MKNYEKWNETGLLNNVPESKKEKLAIKLQEAEKILVERNANDEVEVLIFPLIVRYFDVDEEFDVDEVVADFIKYYDEIDSEMEYLEKWVNNKVKSLDKDRLNYISSKIFDCVSKAGNANFLGIKVPTDFFETFNENERVFGVCVDNGKGNWVKKYKVTIEQL